jgi:DNA-directed RNA polymerase specialized sigma24 family protein
MIAILVDQRSRSLQDARPRTARQIASTMGISTAAVKSHTARAMTWLQALPGFSWVRAR